MGSYDFFQAQPGPQIDINLFGNAATQGAALGKAIPSPLTSIIQGGIEGYKTGLDIAAKQEQTESIRIRNQEEALKLSIAQDTEALQRDATRETLLDTASKLKADREQRDLETQFTDQYQNAATPEERKQLIFDPQYASVFADKPNLYKQVTTNPSVYPYLNDQEKEAVDLNFKKATTSKFYEQEKYRRGIAFKNASTAVNEDPLTNILQDQLSLPPEQFPGNVEFVPAGRYKYTNGNIELDSKTRQRVLNPSPDAALKNQYDVIDKTGKLLSAGAQEKSRQTYLTFLKEQSYQDGSFRDKALSNIQPTQKETPQVDWSSSNANSGFTTFSDQSRATEPKSIKEEYDPVRFHIQKTLNLSDNGVRSLGSEISSIKTQVDRYIQSPDTRASADAQQSMNQTVTNIARKISDEEYSTNPALRAQYTEKDVADFNKTLDDAVDSNPFGLVVSDETRQNISGAYKVSSPQDLYYVKRRDVLESQMNQALSRILASEYAKHTQPIRAQAASKNINALFIKAANGGVNPTR